MSMRNMCGHYVAWLPRALAWLETPESGREPLSALHADQTLTGAGAQTKLDLCALSAKSACRQGFITILNRLDVGTVHFSQDDVRRLRVVGQSQSLENPSQPTYGTPWATLFVG